jgi:hypothetical protein
LESGDNESAVDVDGDGATPRTGILDCCAVEPLDLAGSTILKTSSTVLTGGGNLSTVSPAGVLGESACLSVVREASARSEKLDFRSDCGLIIL